MASGAARRVGPHTLGEAGPLKVRAFFGLPVPDAHRRELHRFLEQCAAVAPEFRWTPASNLHLTIRFLGHVEQALAESIARAVQQLAPAGFELQLGDVGTFKRGRLARVVWLGLATGTEPARALAELVEAQCRAAGLEPETRAFNVHLTLARARARAGAPLPDVGAPAALPAWHARGLVLYRSHLGRGGSVYEPIVTIPLR